MALRLMHEVYGAVVMLPDRPPAAGHGRGLRRRHRPAMIDVGRYPEGIDERCEEICAAPGRVAAGLAPACPM